MGGRVLLDLDPVPRGEERVGIAAHELHEPAPDWALPLEPVDLGVLPRQERPQQRRRVRPQVLPRELALRLNAFRSRPNRT